MFKNKILLITGGTGSFGESFLRKVLSSKILFKEIRIFSRDEKKQEDLRKNINNKNVKFIIGDVRDKESLNSAVNGSNLIFHAAALKQVPSCEFYPLEAIKTNILGTNNLNFNAFFVLKNISYTLDNLKKNLNNLENYSLIKIRDSKDKRGELNFIDKKERLLQIKDLEVTDVSQINKKVYKISEIINSI